jgi:MFS family permease
MNAATPILLTRPLGLLLATRAGSNTANHMLVVVAGWQIYELTDSALALGLIGLVQFLPPLCLTLLAGQFADQFDRRAIMRWSFLVQAMVAGSMALLSTLAAPPIALIYILLLIQGICRTFEGPSVQALLPAMVPREQLGRAIPAFSSVNKLSQIVGPAAGGLLYAVGEGPATYFCCLVLVLAAVAFSSVLPSTPAPPREAQRSWKTVLAGLDFIWNTKPLLGAMSLDLMATLFGGVTALLPIFARDILEVGPTGFGLLRSAPAFGGFAIAAVLARYPMRRAAGLVMFAGMSLYGAATIAFGLSHNVALSFVLLLLIGAGDMMSTVIRQTLIQFATPDDRRGRVLAVNTLCSQTAGQLGTFESGLVAEFIGAAGSAVFGGVAVFAVVAFWAWRFPSLRRVDRPTEVLPD